jgi:phage terminase large subunit-like protein
VKQDEAGSRKLNKARSRGRIDGMVALLMGASVASEEKGKSKVFPVEEELILE